MFLARLGLSAVQNVFGSKKNDTSPDDISKSISLVGNCIDSHGTPPGIETDHLPGGVIQYTVDLMQDLLDNDDAWKIVERDPTEVNKLQVSQLLMQFAEQFRAFPKSFFITVEPSSIRPFCGGTNSQIYSGQWKDRCYVVMDEV
ncbi:hypothetical protein QCA50_019562 [Cerrena zonata]|uniref:Uncharacterized protein n=1 Tax=Cerrena zonata TaxID=2478898 RepID=A0AAW0FF14_9APHY